MPVRDVDDVGEIEEVLIRAKLKACSAGAIHVYHGWNQLDIARTKDSTRTDGDGVELWSCWGAVCGEDEGFGFSLGGVNGYLGYGEG